MVPEVLMISKPIVPPFDDSGKNIVVSQIQNGQTYRYRVLTVKNASLPWPNVASAAIYGNAGEYSPQLTQNIKVMMYGLRPRGASIYHYFFAPNLITSTAGRLQKLLAKVKTVQTVCSQPKSFENIKKLIFADRVIVLSEMTRKLMVDGGISENRLVHVRPGIDFIKRQNSTVRGAIKEKYGIPKDAQMVVFPGDYEFSSAASTVAKAVPLLVESHSKICIVFACRIKRPASLAIRDTIKAQIKEQGFSKQTVFLERVEDMPSFVGAADVAVMPSESLYAKMDMPLVLLEAASQRVPLVVANTPPLSELLTYGMGIGVEPGNENELAQAVGSILDNSAEAARFGEAGETAIFEHFNAQKTAAEIEKIYDEVMLTQ